ncbi:hypothetical protein AB0M19_29700 [Streptomyces sp. NPDC051920]|uniref:hypothetical protein n=1 Tax=Streptomyces sp. NPDC051920 TaxID=3155523 RepID=UPI0034210AEB
MASFTSFASFTSALIRPRPDLCAGAATGLGGGVYLVSAPLLGGPVGMPGEAVRYLLPTGLLLAGAVGAVLRWRGRAAGGTAAARRAVAVCLLAGTAPLFGSPTVFAGLLMLAAALTGGSLGLYRPEHSWHAACLAGTAAAGGATVLLAERPDAACALGCGLAALLLVPSCRRADAPEGGGGYAAPPRWTAAATGAAVFGVLFAVQSLVVFRWELLGGAGARPFAWAALSAGALVCGLAVIGGRRPGAGSGPRTALFAAGLTAAVAACAGAARPWQLTAALATALACGAAAAVRAPSPGPPDTGPVVAALLGGAAAMTAIALSGRLATGPDTLVAIGLAPALATTGALVLGSARRDPAHRPPGAVTATAATAVNGVGSRAEDCADGRTGGVASHVGGAASHADGAGPVPLCVRGLRVRTPGEPPVRRLGLAVEAGEVAYLTDTLPGRRTGAVLAVLGGLRRADAGSWRLRGHDVSRVGERGRWDLRMSAFIDPADAGRAGALHRGHPAVSVADAVAAAVAHLGHERAAELTESTLAAFPFLKAKGPDAWARLGPDERCVLGLAQALVLQPTLLLLDLTGPGCGPLAADPAVTAVLRHIADRGTAVLVAAPVGQAVPAPRPLVLPTSGGRSWAALLRRNGKAMP